VSGGERILLSHGGGGRTARALVENLLLGKFSNSALDPLDDAALLGRMKGEIAFTTDSFVVEPLFFPGGDIGRLAVCGTVNDLSVMGARPRALSCALVIEEGFPVADLEKILESMRSVLDETGVPVVTGDTKVVERGGAGGVYINTAGIGEITGVKPGGAQAVSPGDAIIVTGPVGDHGAAVLATREGLEFDTEIRSDCAPVDSLVRTLLYAAPGTKFMRDPTRGGLCATLNELAASSGHGIEIEESAVPVRGPVAALCGILGLDPFQMACEGRFVAVAPAGETEPALAALKAHPTGREAAVIGYVVDANRGLVAVRTPLGSRRIMNMPAGDPLPRIC